MPCYTTLHSGGYKYTSDERMLMYLYPNDSLDDKEAKNAVANGLRDACEAVYNYSSNIGYYEINYTDTHPKINTDDQSKCDTLGDWGVWYSNNSCGGSTYDARTGSHALVVGEHLGGCAYSGTPTAFNTSKAAVVGTGGGVKEQFINTAVQEVFHSFINGGVIKNKYSYLIKNDDHDLGKVYGDCSISPMASGYEDSHARHGECSSSNAWCGTYTRRPTDCTDRGMDYSAKEA